jgi:hypothetical protein
MATNLEFSTLDKAQKKVLSSFKYFERNHAHSNKRLVFILIIVISGSLLFMRDNNVPIENVFNPPERIEVDTLTLYSRSRDVFALYTGNGNFSTGKSATKKSRYVPDNLSVLTPLDSIHIPPGMELPCELLTTVSTSSKNVFATLLTDLRVDGELLAQKGARISGKLLEVNDRYHISFNSIETLTHDKKAISALAVDIDDKSAGISPNKWRGKFVEAGKNLGLTFLSGLADGLKTPTRKATLSNALLNGTSEAAKSEAQNTISEMRSSDQTTLPSLLAGKDFILLFE